MSRARHKKASGGKIYEGESGGGEHEYDAEGTPAMAEAKKKEDSFKHGGHAKKKKHGGAVHGMKPKHRADKAPRRAAGGRSPLSSAAGSKGRPGGDYANEPSDKKDD